MKYIALVAVIAILVLQFSGAIPQSSVGGPMTIATAFLIAALAAGIYEAVSNKRGVLGWIASLITAVVGAFVAASLGSMVMETLLMNMNLQGSLAETRHPLLYIGSAFMMLMTVFGAWLALRLVNQLR